MLYKQQNVISGQNIGLYLNHSKSRCSNFLVKTFLLLLLFSVLAGCASGPDKESDPKKVLILSGRNNHDWAKTTAVLLKMYRKLPGYDIQVTEDPEVMTYEELKKYDVLVSNWNNWPDNDIEWDPAQEKAFKEFVEEGGGTVFFHAGASSYYNSEMYHKIGIGRWGKETFHGKETMGKVYDLNQDHPVTKGIQDFFIMDEIWEKADVYPGVQVLASIRGNDQDESHEIIENTVYVNEIGKGRCFYTTLGHNERALFNTGLQTLLIRATEWVATGEVTFKVPQSLQKYKMREESDFSWQETDTTLQFFYGSKLVWQYNFRNRFGKPYFHPIYLRNTKITCESPTDHVWHYGLWFSWKFINGLNYWEYTNDFKSEKTGFKSEGTTEIQNIDIRKNQDHSVDILLDIQYHPETDPDPVLREKRNIHVSQPDEEGSYYFDYEHHFSAEYGDVTIDRTPILGEPDGKSWGGYGGLSIRFNQDFTTAKTLPAVRPPDYPKNEWFFMSITSLAGEPAGVSMFQHPDYTTSSTRWYYLMDQSHPFFYFGPAAVYDKNIELKKGESLTLKYRVWILSETDNDLLQTKYNQYIQN